MCVLTPIDGFADSYALMIANWSVWKKVRADSRLMKGGCSDAAAKQNAVVPAESLRSASVAVQSISTVQRHVRHDAQVGKETHTSPAHYNAHEKHELGTTADTRDDRHAVYRVSPSDPLTILANQTHSQGDVVRGGVGGESNEWGGRHIRPVELKATPSTCLVGAARPHKRKSDVCKCHEPVGELQEQR